MNPNKADVLFLSHRYNIVSGGEKALLEMVRHTVSLGLKPHVIIGSKGDIVQHLDKMDVPYSEIFLPFWAHSGNDPSPFHFTSLNPTVNTTRQIVELIRTIQPKLCVTNTIVVPWLGYASSLTGTPHAWCIHELGTAGFNFRYAIGEADTLRSVDLLSDAIFYNSKTTAEYYLPHFPHHQKINVIYPASQPLPPDPIPSPFRAGAFKLVAVGQIKPQKGQFDAVKAIALLQTKDIDVQLCIVGGIEDAQYKKEMMDFIDAHNLSGSIIFTSQQANPSSYFALADASIVCATNEAFGRVAVESMFIGTPVIGADSAGTAEIIDSETIGLLYKAGDINDLASKIDHLRLHPDKAADIAKQAKKTVTKRYDDTARFKQFIDYFNSLDGSKTALNLSPLASSFTDFTATVNLFEQKSRRLEAIENSKQWKLMRSIKKGLTGKQS